MTVKELLSEYVNWEAVLAKIMFFSGKVTMLTTDFISKQGLTVTTNQVSAVTITVLVLILVAVFYFAEKITSIVIKIVIIALLIWLIIGNFAMII